MIVSHRWRFVYLGPPKTASTSLHRWLAKLLDVPCPQGEYQHATTIPAECRDYFTFASVRNPWARAVSLWAHSQTSWARALPCHPPLTFAEFCQWRRAAGWFYAWPQSAYLACLPRWDALVRVEHLAADLAALPPLAALAGCRELPPLPHDNALAHADWPVYYTESLRVEVARYCREDFALGLSWE